MRQKIGECLIQAGQITEEDLRTALTEHKRTGERIGIVLIRMGMATEEQVAKALAFQLGFPYIDLLENPPDLSAAIVIPKEVALTRHCVAVALEKNALTVAMADPLLFRLVQDLEFQTGHHIKQVVSTKGAIVAAIQACYPDTALARTAQPATVANTRDDATPIVELVDRIITGAVTSAASDIHIEATDTRVLIRHRIDGRLIDAMELPVSVREELVARVKAMAGMDVAEQRLPQDGRIRVRTDAGTDIDYRVSTLRTLYGEKIVMRVLDRRKTAPALEAVGLSPAALEQFRQLLRHQHGMILVAGPAGSGTTTTLTAALTAVRSEHSNLITIEDPIEYEIEGVSQTEIDEGIGLTYPSALRSVLRQDPDVVMLGDLRDAETAAIATQAAQNGPLILSALHADDALASIARMAAIGSEPPVTASVLLGVVAQRLVRRLCDHCRRPYTPPPEILLALGMSEGDAPSIVFYSAVGCDQCHHTGYRGRVGIFEVMRITDGLRRLIASRAPEEPLREAAIAGGMVTLGEDGLAKVKSGVTTAEELFRVVTEVREMRSLCAGCGTAVGVDFKACPQCGKAIGGGCPHCGRALEAGWNFCPYCTRSTTESTTAARRLRAKTSEAPTRGGG